MTIDELRARLTEIRGRLQEIDTENAGQALPAEARAEFERLVAERDETDRLIAELEARHEQVERAAAEPRQREDGAAFHINRPATRGEDIWDLSTVRSSVSNPGEATEELRERALRALEVARFPHERADRERVQSHVRRLLDTAEQEDGRLARHLLVTGSPVYKRAFGKAILGKPVTQDEQRALSLTGASGGFAVPYELDPTVIPTSNLAVNPYRAISRVEQITVDEWRGVSSAGVTAAFAAEATEAADNTPTLAQPTVSTEKAQAFIPYSIEIGMDWGSLQAEMARLLQDSKDELEADKFTVGTGTNEPFGVLTGATTTVTAGGTAAFAASDVYKVEEDLGPRFRPLARWIANRFVYNKVRQFDTQGGAQLWIQNLRTGLENQVPTPGSVGAELIGYPAYEASAMAAALTTANKIAVLGDFRHFLIADRIGMTVELVAHLFGANRRPTGQRGLYCYWRVGSKVLTANAFRVLVTG